MAKIKYRLALDMGTNSLGWCVYRLGDNDEPVAFQRMGVRIFSDGRDPKTLASLAADRRAARQARRRRDRVLKRRQRLMQGLIRFGLMPADDAARKALQTDDPYDLRARGLDQALTLHQLGRAIFHLARKRGFKSSRKDRGDAEAAKETGKVHAAIAALEARITAAQCRTVGEYLAKQHAERLPVRARRSNDGQYVLYLQRTMVEREFDQLWEAQKVHHPHALSDEARDYLRDTMLFQRRLQPVMPGRCLFEAEHYRAPMCSPLQQRFRILQELNNLRVRDGIGQRPLTLEERNQMLAALEAEPGLVTFSKLAKLAGLRNASQFNLESEKRKGLRGDNTSALFAGDAAFGKDWHAIDGDIQEALARLVERADDNTALINALKSLPTNLAPARDVFRPHPHEEELFSALSTLPAPLSEAQATAIARFQLQDDYGSLSLAALRKIVPELEHAVITYDVAVQRAGYQHHSQLHTGEFFQRLPYYGEILRGYTSPADKAQDAHERRFGKIANPTVHVGLNQLRQLVNALIKRFGHPHEVIIELTREFGASGEKRREITKAQAENQTRNERYDAELAKLSIHATRENRLKLQLWEELGKDDALDRYCVYSGTRLSKAMLFSDEVEIDHILPFSRTLHDGVGNKILCTRQSNRDKGNRTPFEAWGHTNRWEAIVERASRLPGRKALLFRENALEDFLGGTDFLARHLSDTAYLARAAKQYLSYICPKDYVWVSSGKLTGMLRGKWGLGKLLWDDGKKNRNDHRHHALDAAVIGSCSRSLIQRVATAAARAEDKGENRLLEGLELPWPTFRDDLREGLGKIVVSHKPDRGTQSALHKAGNYGRRINPDNPDEALYSAYVPLESIGFGNVVSSEGKRGQPPPKVRDPHLRQTLTKMLEGKTDKQCREALLEFSSTTGIKRVQVQRRRESVIPICRNSQPYRFVFPDQNYCRDIVNDETGKWTSNLINSFEANGPTFRPDVMLSSKGRSVIMRLRKGDLLLVEKDGERRYMRVASFTNDGLALADHYEANTADRDGKPGFSYLRVLPEPLRKLRARPIGVDILGYVNDPGFRE